MDADNIFSLLTWVVPGYAGVRAYWYSTAQPRQRGSTETILASLGWTVAVAVPVMLLLGGLPLIDPEKVSLRVIGTWFGSLGATVIAGWVLGKIRASERINTRVGQSAFTSSQAWMSARLLRKSQRVEVCTGDARFRGSLGYMDDNDEGGSVALYNPEVDLEGKGFQSMDVEAVLILGSRIVWITQLRE